jgi:ribose transport system ATP-binding protein
VSAAPLLRISGAEKSFFGFRAVRDVSFTVDRGEIVALLGENGAGKSTLIKMLAGVYSRDGGAMELDGVDVDQGRTRSRIAFIHQDLGLVEWMTVAENMALTLGFPRTRLRTVDWRRVRSQAAEALARVGGTIDPETRVFDLPRTEKSLLAIARGLVTDPDLLVLDEPTASLPAAEVERLFEVLRALRDQQVGMIYVSHRLDEVFAISDRVVVMRNGAKVHDGATASLDRGELVHAIVGKETRQVTRSVPRTRERIRLDRVVVGDVGPVDLTVAEGEIVGLVGLRGAGQDAVGRALAGQRRIRSGRVLLDGDEIVLPSTVAAVANGIGFATSNREAEGLAAGMSVQENMFLNPGVWGRRWFRPLGRTLERERATDLIDRFGVRPASPIVAADTLSGGNQQKVILSRWMGLGRSVLVLEEPTMGVDVGAKADIYGLLAEACERGTAAVVVSTDLEEVATVCHRAVVFNRGRVTAQLTGDEITVSALVAAVSGLEVA